MHGPTRIFWANLTPFSLQGLLRKSNGASYDGAWRFDDVIARTRDASEFDTDNDEDEADRAVGLAASITQSERYDVDWDDIDSSHRPAMQAARLMHTARQIVDTSR